MYAWSNLILINYSVFIVIFCRQQSTLNSLLFSADQSLMTSRGELINGQEEEDAMQGLASQDSDDSDT